jgi:hypothetical protein
VASGSDVKAGGAYVELFVKGYQATQQQLASIGSGITKLGAGVAAIGAGIVGPLAAAVHHFTEVGGAIDDMSGRTGIARTELAQLGYAASQTGSTLDDIERAIVNQRKKGVKGTFDEVAASIAKIEDPAERTRVAFETWGKSGTKLLTLVDNLQDLKAEARGLGIGTSEEDIQNADALGDAFAKIQSQLSATVFGVGAALAPMLLDAANFVSGIVRGVTKWVNENRQLVRGVALVGVGLLAAGTLIAAAGGGLVLIATVMGSVATLAAAVLSPVGLIVAGVVAIGAGLAAAVVYWVRFTSTGQRAFAALVNAFRPFAKTLQTALGGILDAIRGGNIELAFQVMTTGLKLLWLQFIDFATGKFFNLVRAIADNDLVKQLMPELAAKARNAATGSQAALRLEIGRLTMELDRLRAEAAKGVPAPKEDEAVKALGAGIDVGKESERKSVTAQTAAAAIALTFGQRKPGDLTKDMLDELRLIRKHGIPAHRDLLRQFRGFAPRVGA